MIQTISVGPGITLRYFPDSRFKQGCLSIQLVRPMSRQEAACNAILPAVLLRGSVTCPDLRQITLKLDDLYGAGVSAMVRRVGDYQATGLYCNFMEDKYALPGDQVLEPAIRFFTELLLHPAVKNGIFREEYVEGEKKNLISAIEAERNDKQLYALSKMLKIMCKADPYGIPRLGEIEQIAEITPESLYQHYCRILRESRIDLFYIGNSNPLYIADLVQHLFPDRAVQALPPQSPFHDAGCGGEYVEEMEIAQGKLSMGFVTPVTNKSPEFASMQVFNALFGAGMTSKLFMNVREKKSLCYAINSGYYGSKGITVVSAGIDSRNQKVTTREILAQLDACKQGNITEKELQAAKEAIISSLRSTQDSLSAIEGYYSTMNLSGLNRTPEEYEREVSAVTAEQAAAAARTLKLHTTYFLKGADA